jgi:hypothetical protein
MPLHHVDTAHDAVPGAATGTESFDIGDVHTLRLCLDLQLDALLLAVGAASGEARPSDPPWRRWVDEDVELACTLATAARTGGAVLPQAMGSDLDHTVPTATLDSLKASYTSMVTLLTDLSVRTRGLGPLAGRTADESWQRRVDRTLEHCTERLAELNAQHWERPTLRVIDLAEADQAFIPGELLG